MENRETHFSWLRTRMSAERTLMSAIRTAAALIGFGFTIVQFFYRLNMSSAAAPPRFPAAPLLMRLALIGIGTVGLLIAMAEYRLFLRHLWGDDYRDVAGVEKQPQRTPTLVTALLLALVGVFAFGAVLVRAL
jgi:putative membrane protein